jgi:hypothetical protein
MYMRRPILNDVEYKRVKRYSKPVETMTLFQLLMDIVSSWLPIRREIVYVVEKEKEKEKEKEHDYVKSRRLK